MFFFCRAAMLVIELIAFFFRFMIRFSLIFTVAAGISFKLSNFNLFIFIPETAFGCECSA